MQTLILIVIAYIICKSSQQRHLEGSTAMEKLFRTAEETYKAIADRSRRISLLLVTKIKHGRSRNSIPMKKDEAYAILGLEHSASKDDVNSAFRKMMLANHPDKGGSKYIASKIIEARNTLLD